MDNKTLLLIAAAGIGAYAFLTLQKANAEPMFFVPGHGYVPESQLPGLGYQKVGQFWYSQAQIDAAAAAAGVSSNAMPGTQEFMAIWQMLQTIGGELLNVVNLIVTTANRPQVIQEILTKYTTAVSQYYNPNFPYSQQQLEQMSNSELQTVLDTGTLPGVSGVCSDWGYQLKTASKQRDRIRAAQKLAYCRYDKGAKNPRYL